MKEILVLGAGHVVGPHVSYLLDKGFEVTVASRTVSKAEKKVEGSERGRAIEFNIEDEEMLDELVQEHDLVVSLLPYAYHRTVADKCIEHEKNMVTTSYVSDEIADVDQRAQEAGIFIMMEFGLDPGIDHMSARKIIKEVNEKGGKVTSFKSYCGALPAPEDSDNPFGYKVSWSPKGVLLAGKNAAKYLEDGEIVNIPGEELFEHHWIMDIGDLPDLEAYPNRNALPYKEKYQLENAETVFRGTLRYPGWSETLKGITELGWLSEEEREFGDITYRDLTKELIDSGKELKEDVAEYLNLPKDSSVIENIEWLGLLDDEEVTIDKGGLIDVVVERMNEKMSYQEGERDIVILHHIFEVSFPEKREEITSTLIVYGDPEGPSAVAKTVGVPAAIAVEKILNGEISGEGVHIPVKEEIYDPILHDLEDEGIVFEEEYREI